MRPLFHLCLAALTTLVACGTAAAAENVIEFGSDSEGDSAFKVRLRHSAIEPATEFFKPAGSEAWEGSTSILEDSVYGEVPNLLLWSIEAVYDEPSRVAPVSGVAVLDIPAPENGPTIRYEQGRIDGPMASVSKRFEDPSKDWKFLKKKSDAILDLADMSHDASDWDKVQAWATYIYRQRKDTSMWFDGFRAETYIHPVDFFFAPGSNCGGASHSLAALCMVNGIRARTMHHNDHSITEVFVDGQWRFVENTVVVLDKTRKDDSLETGPMFKGSFFEMLADPTAYGFPDDHWYHNYTNGIHLGFDPAKRGQKGHQGSGFMWWNIQTNADRVYNTYSYPDLEKNPRAKLRVGTSLYEMAAMYPQKETLVFKSPSEEPVVHLTPFMESSLGKVIEAGDAVRQTFELPEIDQELVSVKSAIILDREHQPTIPADGGDWYYRVNGETFYLRDHGGWEVKPMYAGSPEPYIEFEIPLDALNLPAAEDAEQ